MSPRKWTFRLQDIAEAIDRIDQYTLDMDYDSLVIYRGKRCAEFGIYLHMNILEWT